LKNFKLLARVNWRQDIKVLALVIFVILAMALGSLILFKRLADQAQKLLFDAMDAMSYAVHQGLIMQFNERYYDVQAFAKNPAVQSMDRVQIEDALNDFIKLYQIYDLIIVTDAQGRLVGSSSMDAAGRLMNVGALYAQNYSKELWFQKVQESRGTYVDQPMVDPYLIAMNQRQQLTNSFATAVIDEQGKWIGVICIRAGVRWIQKELDQGYAMLHAGGFSVARLELIDHDGQVLVHAGAQLAAGSFAEFPTNYPGTKDKIRTSKIWSLRKGSDGDLMVASSFLADPSLAASLDWSLRLMVGSSSASRRLAETVRISYGLIFLASLGLLILAIGYIRRLVIARFLQQEVALRTAELHATARDLEQRNHELEANKAELVATNHQLIEAQKELLDTAKRLGQAEVAALTLHNIGNIMTSLNIQGTLLHEQMQKDEPGQLALAYLKKVQAEGHYPERMTEFVQRIEAAEGEALAGIQGLIRGLIDNARMVMSAISSQQTFVHQSERAEALKLSALLQHTLTLYQGTFKRHQLQPELQMRQDALFLTERFRFESILTVLIRNAIDASVGREPRRIVFTTHIDASFLTLTIVDNGHGFGPEISPRLFHFGFTTKNKGHGFGLHYAANSCKHLGLQLKLESPGPGLGATASVLIPRNRIISLTEFIDPPQGREKQRPNQHHETGAHPA